MKKGVWGGVSDRVWGVWGGVLGRVWGVWGVWGGVLGRVWGVWGVWGGVLGRVWGVWGVWGGVLGRVWGVWGVLECGAEYESAGYSNEMKQVQSKEVRVMRLVFMKEQKDRGMTVVW